MGDDGIDFDVIPDAQKPKDYDIEAQAMQVAAVQAAMRADVEYIVSICALNVRILHCNSFYLFLHATDSISRQTQLKCYCETSVGIRSAS